MNSNTHPKAWTMIAAATVASIAVAFAFSAADTGARSVSATVANDSDAFLAMEANALSAHKDFVSQGVDGKLAVAFGSGIVAGGGINADSTYSFDSLINITNKGSAAVDVDVTISGTDAALCKVALTPTSSQTSADYVADPSAVTLSVGGKAYLGLQVSGAAKTSGQSVACQINVSAE